jgi:hypothetical protein
VAFELVPGSGGVRQFVFASSNDGAGSGSYASGSTGVGSATGFASGETVTVDVRSTNPPFGATVWMIADRALEGACVLHARALVTPN